MAPCRTQHEEESGEHALPAVRALKENKGSRMKQDIMWWCEFHWNEAHVDPMNSCHESSGNHHSWRVH